MIIELIIVLFFGFCCSYPIFLLMTPQKKIKVNFFHFNLGLSIIVGSFALLINLFSSFYYSNKFDLMNDLNLGYIIIILFFSILTWYYWEKKYPIQIIVLISILGLLFSINNFYFDKEIISYFDFINFISSVLGTFTLSSVVFCMILGHWYLNIPHLPVNLIKNAVKFLNLLLFSRLFFNIIIIYFTKIDSNIYGQISFIDYLLSFEGIILWLGILFGIVGAIIINILTIQTIKLQAIQSATGLLYVNLVMILIGEMVFKYFMVYKNILL